MSGIFGVAAQTEKAQDYGYFAMYALQHRGQIGCGMAANKNGYIDYHKELGVVSQTFTRKHLQKLTSNLVLAQIDNSQTHVDEQTLGPVLMGNRTTSFALALDGSFLNRDELCRKHHICPDCTDAELLARMIAKRQMEDLVQAVSQVVPELQGAYAFVLLTHDVLIGMRDPYGVKMLSVGRLNHAHMVSTESCAFESLGAELLGEVEPGSMVILSNRRIAYLQVVPKEATRTCLFEIIYTSRPDSSIQGNSVYNMRKLMGRKLAAIAPAKADMVISSPDSGTVAAMGYAEAAGLPYDIGIIKNRYIGRTFIEPDKELRDMAVQIKLNVIRDTVEGKSIVIVDDSIVRGTTMRRVVSMLKEHGAKAVHVRIASPLVRYPCKIKVNPSIQKDLLADRLDQQGIQDMLGADSLQFLPVEDLLAAIPAADTFCTGCMTAHYPILEDENGTEL
ncbi:MAG: amidophosphoribosyltransferase [Tissierellia bacterium]|nr:amidophosphoribosyltransferase [Bacillota bacterium]NLK59345.1 amidophosphoribosyltransferase [Tissierellia bacterium]